jgi:hypothetical protein
MVIFMLTLFTNKQQTFSILVNFQSQQFDQTNLDSMNHKRKVPKSQCEGVTHPLRRCVNEAYQLSLNKA